MLEIILEIDHTGFLYNYQYFIKEFLLPVYVWLKRKNLLMTPLRVCFHCQRGDLALWEPIIKRVFPQIELWDGQGAVDLPLQATIDGWWRSYEMTPSISHDEIAEFVAYVRNMVIDNTKEPEEEPLARDDLIILIDRKELDRKQLYDGHIGEHLSKTEKESLDQRFFQEPHRRCILNHRELATRLADHYGTRFKNVYCEDLDFAQQVNLFSQAAVVIGQHGSGLINAIWMTGEAGKLLIEGVTHPQFLWPESIAKSKGLGFYRYFDPLVIELFRDRLDANLQYHMDPELKHLPYFQRRPFPVDINITIDPDNVINVIDTYLLEAATPGESLVPVA